MSKEVDISKMDSAHQIAHVQSVYARLQKKRPHRFHCVIDMHLNYPRVSVNIKGSLIIKDSRNMIEKGEVTVNGITVTEPTMELKSGDYIRWGIIKYDGKNHCVVP